MVTDVCWNADRRILYANPDVVIPEPHDLEDPQSWLETLRTDYGLYFAPNQTKRVRQLMLDMRSPHRLDVPYFQPAFNVTGQPDVSGCAGRADGPVGLWSVATTPIGRSQDF